jgi:hypothetical protein
MVEEPSHVKQLSLNHVCSIGLKYAIEGFSHEILHNVLSSLKYVKRAFLTRFYVTWYYFITRQGLSPVTMSRLGVLYECAVHGIGSL